MRTHDAGSFHRLLKRLAINVRGKSREGAEPFSLEDATAFVESVGNEPFNIPDNWRDMLPAQQEVAWSLDVVPTCSEVLQALSCMKDSKGGTDQLTVGSIKACGPWFQRCVVQAVRPLVF